MLNRRFFQITLLITVLATPGCYWKQTTEHLSDSTIQNGLSGNFFNLNPKPGHNEVFIFRDESRYLLPPTGSFSYLFLEIAPTLIKNDQMLNVPSEGVSGRVCTEIHPGFWCSTAIGKVKKLRVTSSRINLYLSIEATREDIPQAGKKYHWDFIGELSFHKSKKIEVE